MSKNFEPHTSNYMITRKEFSDFMWKLWPKEGKTMLRDTDRRMIRMLRFLRNIVHYSSNKYFEDMKASKQFDRL